MRLNTQAYVFWRDIQFLVDYDFSPAQKERGPTYDSGGEPAAPAEIEILAASVVDDNREIIAALYAGLADQFLTETYHDLVAVAHADIIAFDQDEIREDRNERTHHDRPND